MLYAEAVKNGPQTTPQTKGKRAPHKRKNVPETDVASKKRCEDLIQQHRSHERAARRRVFYFKVSERIYELLRETPFNKYYTQRLNAVIEKNDSQLSSVVARLKKYLPGLPLTADHLKIIWLQHLRFANPKLTRAHFGDLTIPYELKQWVNTKVSVRQDKHLTIQQQVVLLALKYMQCASNTEQCAIIKKGRSAPLKTFPEHFISCLKSLKEHWGALTEGDERQQTLYGMYATLSWSDAMQGYGRRILDKTDQFILSGLIERHPLMQDPACHLSHFVIEGTLKQAHDFSSHDRSMIEAIDTIAIYLRSMDSDQAAAMWKLALGEQVNTIFGDTCAIEGMYPWIRDQSAWGPYLVPMTTVEGFPKRTAVGDGEIPLECTEFIPNYTRWQTNPSSKLNWFGPWSIWGVLHPDILDWCNKIARDHNVNTSVNAWVLSLIMLAFQHTCIGCEATSDDRLHGARDALQDLINGNVRSLHPSMTEDYWPKDIQELALSQREEIAKLFKDTLDHLQSDNE